MKALKNNELVGAEISSKDEAVLQALSKVTFTTTYDEEKAHETITTTFHFNPNDYFTNQVLTKTLVVDTDEQAPVESKGSDIEWKEGKNVTKKTVQKK